MNIRNASVSILLIFGISFSLIGCGEEANDSPREEADNTSAFVIPFPNEFTSVAAKCFGTDLLYAARNTNGRAIAVSPNHSWCSDGVLTREEQNR